MDVAVAAIVSGPAAVGSAALANRRPFQRPRRAWTLLASAVFVVTLAGPITSGASMRVTWSLIALHSVVAVVLIPQIRATLRRGEVPTRRTDETAVV